MRKVYLIAVLLLFFAGYVFSASRMERLLATGDDLLLPLAPVDPRALLMGDYMDLDYTLNATIRAAVKNSPRGRERREPSLTAYSGYAVVKVADSPVPRAASFVRLDNGDPLGEGEYLLRFKVRGERVITASGAWYFQEGHARQYEEARYGRVKIAENGKTLLVALCDAAGMDIPTGRE
ncbi:MAG: hypothetical protein DELT_00910 [Desulfovibrio sp.]